MLRLFTLLATTIGASSEIGKYTDGCTPSDTTVCNYQRSEGCTVHKIVHPSSVAEIKEQIESGLKVRAVGVPHSDNGVFCDEGSGTSLVSCAAMWIWAVSRALLVLKNNVNNYSLLIIIFSRSCW